MTLLRQEDKAFIRSTGRDPEEVARQVAVLQAPRQAIDIVRPATIGDGVTVLSPDRAEAALTSHASGARDGRLSSFVPASGAGTRLFSSLLLVHRSGRRSLADIQAAADCGDGDAADALRVLRNIRNLAIWPALESRGCAPESTIRILETLLGEGGLRYDRWPKGLIPYHLYERRARSAFIEHAHDAAALTCDHQGVCRLHITVSPSHQDGFRAEWERHRSELEQETGARVRLDISEQSPRTDGIAIDPAGNLVRNDRGEVLFRPGGHGALLENLSASGGDIVFVRNIDNVVRRDLAAAVLPWRRQMCGLLLQLEAAVHGAVRALRSGLPMPQVHPDVAGRWWTEPDPAWPEGRRRAHLLNQLNRPIRVCGVVPARGHVGGGPFWARAGDAPPSLQIIESAELDTTSAAVRETLARSTHFNPVDMVCGIRDVDGKPFALADFASEDRVIVTKKSVNGVPTRVYEHPGLWNGGMARWLTLFVEIPESTFNPVKSLSDLLRAGHRP